MNRLLIFILLTIILLAACQKEDLLSSDEGLDFDFTEYTYFAASNPDKRLTDEKAALGRLLFYDTRLSKNNAISCATCHQQTKGFADGLQFSNGLFDRQTTRNSMSIVNINGGTGLFWTGHGFVHKNILDPITNHIEMGIESKAALVEKLAKTEDYPLYFETVFEGKVNVFDSVKMEVIAHAITDARISEAVEVFVRSIKSTQTPYDNGMLQNFSNFTLEERRGQELFNGKAQCANCHRGQDFLGSWTIVNIGLDKSYADKGAGKGRFKTPTLRNIELTAPYMHDGRFATLEEVVEHYNSGIQAHPNLNWRLKDHEGKPIRLNLSTHEKHALIAFLKTLTDEALIQDQKFSNPF